MFDPWEAFRAYCAEQGLALTLSQDMPAGYETANGVFVRETKTVYFNADMLRDAPDHEKAFYLFHELRHASQYLQSEHYCQMIRVSLRYVIQYDGTCYKQVNGEWRGCKLDGGTEYFTDLYLGQPHELDANAFAYARVKSLLGDSEELRELYRFWLPKKPVTDVMYEELYAMIDQKLRD